MMNILTDSVSSDRLIEWLVIFTLVAYFVYKEWPTFRERITAGSARESARDSVDADLEKRMASIEKRMANAEKRVEGIDQKLLNDYREIVDIRNMTQESLEEREILMRGLLGALKGLQELGANGPTKQAESEIHEYLNRKAHKKEEKRYGVN